MVSQVKKAIKTAKRNRRTNHHGAVSTRVLADLIGYSERQMLRVLKSLCEQGVVIRLDERKGYLLAA